MELTEKQKKFLVANQDIYSLEVFSKKLRCTTKEVYDAYSNLFKTGEYTRIYAPIHTEIYKSKKYWERKKWTKDF